MRLESKRTLSPVKIAFAWLCVVAWMTLIFYFSNQPADQSSQLSMAWAERLIRFLGLAASSEQVARLDSLLRFLAHAAIFFILGVLAFRAFTLIGKRRLTRVTASLLLCLFYAGFDELHQSLVPGRASQWSDFLTDGIGSLLGIGTCLAAAVWFAAHPRLSAKP